MMDDSLEEKVEEGRITAEAAYLKAQDKARFEQLMKEEGATPPPVPE